MVPVAPTRGMSGVWLLGWDTTVPHPWCSSLSGGAWCRARWSWDRRRRTRVGRRSAGSATTAGSPGDLRRRGLGGRRAAGVPADSTGWRSRSRAVSTPAGSGHAPRGHLGHEKCDAMAIVQHHLTDANWRRRPRCRASRPQRGVRAHGRHRHDGRATGAAGADDEARDGGAGRPSREARLRRAPLRSSGSPSQVGDADCQRSRRLRDRPCGRARDRGSIRQSAGPPTSRRATKGSRPASLPGGRERADLLVQR